MDHQVRLIQMDRRGDMECKSARQFEAPTRLCPSQIIAPLRGSAPNLYLSSSSAGWVGIQAQAYLEPPEFEGWFSAVTPSVNLMLFRGPGMRIESRRPHGSWRAVSVHDGDLSLRAGWNAPVEVRWRTFTDDGPATRTLHVQVSRELLQQSAEEVMGRAPGSLALQERMGFHDPLLAQIGFALWGELELPTPTGRLYAESAGHLLAVHLLRRYTPNGADMLERIEGRRLTHRQLEEVTTYVEDHLNQDLTLNALAQHIGFSAFYFARLLRQTTGESPHQFVLRRRVAQARHLLEQADLSLTEVAIATGFAHQSHLTRHFKQAFGQTPSAYRRERLLQRAVESDEQASEPIA